MNKYVHGNNLVPNAVPQILVEKVTIFPHSQGKQLEMWAINDELSFSQQDQDLILAIPTNLELLLEFLDSPHTHIKEKNNFSIHALHTLV